MCLQVLCRNHAITAVITSFGQNFLLHNDSIFRVARPSSVSHFEKNRLMNRQDLGSVPFPITSNLSEMLKPELYGASK